MNTENSPVRRCRVATTLGEMEVSCLFDTGCAHNIIGIDHKLVDIAELIPLTKTMYFRGAFSNDRNINADHFFKISLNIKMKNKQTLTLKDLQVKVVNSHMESGLIIGLNTMQKHKIIIGGTLGVITKRNTITEFEVDNQPTIHSVQPIQCIRENKDYIQEFASYRYTINHTFGDNAIFRITEKDGTFTDHELTNNEVILEDELNPKTQWEVFPSVIKEIKLEECNDPKAERIMRIQKYSKTHNQKLTDIINKVSIGEHLSPRQRERLRKLLKHHSQAISLDEYDIGYCSSLQYRADTTNNNPQAAKIFNLPLDAKKVVSSEVQKLVRAGLLKHDPSIRTITSVFIPILKPTKDANGKNQWRLVNDLRSCNTCLKPENITIPRIDDLLSKAANRKVYCTLDLRKSFWAIRLAEEQRHLFTVEDPLLNKQYYWCVMPMGAKGGTSTMQKAASNLLFEGIDIDNYSAYVDDVIIWADDEESMFNILDRVLYNYTKHGFKLNMQKCDFFKREVKAFGFIISREGIRGDPKKVAGFDNIKKPGSKKELRSALGAMAYYRRLIPKFAETTADLYGMLKVTGNKLIWNNNLNKSWFKLLETTKHSILLNRPDLDKPFYVSTDASGVALGGILRQKDQHGQLTKIIAVFSYKLKDTERRWECSQRELHAIFKSVKAFEKYLFGRHFTIITDSRVNVLALSSTERQIARTGYLSPALRFINYLSQFSFSIQHSSGKAISFILVDLLSRLNIDMKNKILRYGKNSRECLLYLEDIKSGKLDPLTDTNIVLTVDIKICPSQSAIHQCIKAAQKESKRIKNLMTDISEGITKGYRIDKEGYVWKNQDIVCPPHYTWTLLDQLHQHAEGRKVLLRRLREYKIHLEFKYKIIHEYQKSCATCMEAMSSGKLKGYKQTYNDVQDTNEAYAADLFHFGNIPIMLLIDEFSSFCWTSTLKKDTAECYVETLSEMILRYGGCRRLRTDNGRQWTSRLFGDFVKALGIHHTTSIPRWSRGNGACERKILSYQTELRCLQPDPDGSDINSALAIATLRINTRKSENKAYTPFQIMMGRNPAILQQIPDLSKTAVQNLDTRMRRIYKETQTIINKILDTEMSKLNLKTPQDKPKLKIGDTIKIINYRQPGELKKLYRPFSRANYRVVKVLDFCNAALVERMTQSETMRPYRCRVHTNQVKKIKIRDYSKFDDDIIEETDDNKDEEQNEPNDHTDTRQANNDKLNELDTHMDNRPYKLRKRTHVSYKE